MKRLVVICNDCEGWFTFKILGTVYYEYIFYNHQQNPMDYLSTRPVFLFIGHSSPNGLVHGHIPWNQIKAKHMITCYYNTKTRTRDSYIRLPGLNEQSHPVLYLIDSNRPDALQINQEYRQRLEMIQQQQQHAKTNQDIWNTYKSLVLPFVWSRQLHYESWPDLK